LLFLGFLFPSECSLEYATQGTVCTWSCIVGYGVRGARHTLCQETGQWSETAFYCEGRIANLVKIAFIGTRGSSNG